MASQNGCPLEMHRIPIEACDEMFDRECSGDKVMPFYRARYDGDTGQSPNRPREQVRRNQGVRNPFSRPLAYDFLLFATLAISSRQLNRMTSWIDGSFVYSTQEAWVNTMRSFRNGSLKWMAGNSRLPPYNQDRVPLFNVPSPHVLRRLSPERMFVLGDPRTNQNPAFLALGILFYRWHNVLARRIQRRHPGWTDEDVFQAARRVNIATLQVSAGIKLAMVNISTIIVIITVLLS